MSTVNERPGWLTIAFRDVESPPILTAISVAQERQNPNCNRHNRDKDKIDWSLEVSTTVLRDFAREGQ